MMTTHRKFGVLNAAQVRNIQQIQVVENKTGRKIKCLRSDNGTEYTNSRFIELCKEHGIKRHFIVRKTP